VRGLALALGCTWLALGCGGVPLYETPEERGGSLPLTRAEHPRAGELTWRPGLLEQTPEAVLFEFTLLNGTTRDCGSCCAGPTARSRPSAIPPARLPQERPAGSGPISPHPASPSRPRSWS